MFERVDKMDIVCGPSEKHVLNRIEVFAKLNPSELASKEIDLSNAALNILPQELLVLQPRYCLL